MNTDNNTIGNIYYDYYLLQAERINCEIGVPIVFRNRKNYLVEKTL